MWFYRSKGETLLQTGKTKKIGIASGFVYNQSL